MTYEDAMKYITEVGNFGSNYGLERTHRLLELLGNPHKELKLIHIAGTNGKGSTTSMITKVLIGAGYKVGMYTSPFLEEFEERIQINNINIPKVKLTELVQSIIPVVDRVIEEGFNHPTEFEIITVLMLKYFHDEKIDFGVIEVGLGGRLDSTNVITPILSVITSISFDHVNLLGNDLGSIAKEKAGIIKEGIPVVIYPQQREAYDVIVSRVKEMNTTLYQVDTNTVKIIDIIKGDKPYQLLEVNNNGKYNVQLPLLGEHQVLNFAVVTEVIKRLNEDRFTNISKEIIIDSIKDVKWIGRLEVLKNNPLVVIDGAHNIQGITALKTNVQKYFNYNKIYLILGILADKDVEEMVKTICPMATKVFAVTPNSYRAELAEDLKNEVIKYNSNCIAFDNYEDALIAAYNEAAEDDLVLASGSLYMIGDLRKLINKKGNIYS